jgi:hypothetical protein
LSLSPQKFSSRESRDAGHSTLQEPPTRADANHISSRRLKACALCRSGVFRTMLV